jgi:hypothetical protein
MEDLLANVTPQAMREAFDWGEDLRSPARS